MKRIGFVFGLLVMVLACKAQSSGDQAIFDRFLTVAKTDKLAEKPAGAQMEAIARFFLGTPYVGGTLEGDAKETLRVNLRELDCTTLVENVLALHLTLASAQPTFDAFKQNLFKIRYRNAELFDYTSRLHYTAEWIANNEKKGFVATVPMGEQAKPFPLTVYYMTANPRSYPALEADPSLLPALAAIEGEINGLSVSYVPKAAVKSVYPLIQSGDIIAITTDAEGLDYSHLGIAVKDAAGVVRLLHASSSAKQVVVSETDLFDYLAGVKRHTGITVVRAK
jgi:hypothetical protein